MLRDCRSASGEDGAFEDDGEATIRFEPLDRREQESADDVIAETCRTASETSLDLLQKIYRSVKQPMSRRMRAAIEALPFERPKLSAVAVMNGEDFSSRLDRAIAMSKSGPLKLIEHRQDEQQQDG